MLIILPIKAIAELLVTALRTAARPVRRNNAFSLTKDRGRRARQPPVCVRNIFSREFFGDDDEWLLSQKLQIGMPFQIRVQYPMVFTTILYPVYKCLKVTM